MARPKKYPTLIATMINNGITYQELAERVDMQYQALYSRVVGKTQMTFQEAVAIRKALNTNIPLEKLFEEAC